LRDVEPKFIYEYEDIRGEPHAVAVSNINPYLVNAPNYTLRRRSQPICNVPPMGIGNQPIDGGYYLFTDDQKREFLSMEPKARPFFRRWLGAEEFINGLVRWCLWLGDAKPYELRSMPNCLERVEAVQRYRLASKREVTRRMADTPTRFHFEFLPDTEYLLVPSVSSERREWVPVGFEPRDVMASNLVLVVPGATIYDFAVINSTMHNAWLRSVGGRLKSDYRYSGSIVYNNYPWPEINEIFRVGVDNAGQAILHARAKHQASTLADLYDPRTMPPNLRKAHVANDRAVDAAYGYKGDKSDAARVAFLFELYGKITGLPPSDEPQPRRRRR